MNENKIEEIIKTYESIVKVVDKKAREDKNRSYGGIIRSIKGWLQEYMTEEIIKLAWDNIKGDAKRLEINSKKHKIPIQRIYVENIKDIEIKNYIFNNIKKYYYSLSVDKQVFVDNKFVLGIECKAYTENAMLKRILVDFSLLKTSYPEINCYLFQLESQLGGDYSKLNKKTYGSYPTHTLMSYFPEVNLNIFTFLEGERKVDKPIHKYFKSLNKNKIKEAVELLSFDLKRYL
ncbi:MAG TPA: restriction endonuclease [Spirochaetota bacterium]|nr:restriction endonuclease [Spirochaetota bacterium]